MKENQFTTESDGSKSGKYQRPKETLGIITKGGK